jgi:alcohol dehydrogenase, propanol-preferring
VRAIVLRAQGPVEGAPLRLEEVPRPVPARGEVLVRVGACGVCRTDLHVVEGDLPLVRSPLVPGHQAVGRVEATGAEAARFRVGDRVGVAWLRGTCGACEFCASGRENLCGAATFTGWHADGGYAEYAVVPEAYAYAIPDAFSDVAVAPLLCAGIIGYRALKLAPVAPGGTLGLYGFGSSAHITLQIAVARGSTVYVCTRDPAHRELARALGAAWVGEPSDRMPTPADGIVIFAPAGDLVPRALRNLAAGGTVALAGIHMSEIPALTYGDLYHERAIRSVTASTRADGVELLAEAARIPIRPTITRFPLEDANYALALLKAGRLTGTGVLVPSSV